MINLLKRLNARLLAWQRKHPILDAIIGSIFVSMFGFLYVFAIRSFVPVSFEFVCFGIPLGFVISWIGDIWANCFHILRSGKEAE